MPQTLKDFRVLSIIKLLDKSNRCKLSIKSVLFQCLDTTTEERKTIYLVDIKQKQVTTNIF